MASVDFNDGAPGSVANSITVPAGNRFRGWTPIPTVIGPRRISLIGLPHVYRRRVAYRVSASIEELLPAQLDVAQRAIVHLESGGQVTLTTGDNASRTHTCYMAAGDSASISAPDDQGHFIFSFALSVYPEPGTPPLCVYYTS